MTLSSADQEFKAAQVSLQNNSGYEDGKGLGATASEWSAPLPLPSLLPLVPSLDADMLPVGLRSWVCDISERMQTPLAFGAVSAMIAIAAVVGRKACVFPKRHDDWHEVPNLWGLLVGRPGIMKSPVMTEIMRPLDRLIAQAEEEYRKAMDEFGIFVTVQQAKISAVENELKKAAGKPETAENQSLINPLATKLMELKNGTPIEPHERRYRTNDATVEMLQSLLAKNENGLLVYRDEIAGLLLAMTKAGREGDRQFFLEAWKGNGSYVVDRVGRGTVRAKGLCLSLLGSIQPGRLRSYVADALYGGVADDGMIQRFQLAVWPDQPEGWQNVDRWPDAESKEQAWNVFRRLADLQKHHLKILANSAFDQDGIPGVRFDSGAQTVFDHWRAALEHRLRSGSLHPAMESHLAKYRGLMPSLALLFHLIDHAQRAELTAGCIPPISESATTMSVRWCDFLEAHAQRLYAADINKEGHVAQALAEHIYNGDIVDGVTVRTIHRHHWSLLKSTENVYLALAILTRLNWLRIEEVKSAGRPSEIVRLNPMLGKASANREGDTFGTFGFWHLKASLWEDENSPLDSNSGGAKGAKSIADIDIESAKSAISVVDPGTDGSEKYGGLRVPKAKSAKRSDAMDSSADDDGDDIDLMLPGNDYARPAMSVHQVELPLSSTSVGGKCCPHCGSTDVENGFASWRCRDCDTSW